MPDPDDDDRTLAGDDAGPARAHAQPIGRGATLGRYVVLEQLGAGGMGVVLAAYDPQLDRKVALKLLHAEPGMPGGSTSAGEAPSTPLAPPPSLRSEGRPPA